MERTVSDVLKKIPMLKFLIVVIAACIFTYFAFHSFTGEYYDIPYLDFI